MAFQNSPCKADIKPLDIPAARQLGPERRKELAMQVLSRVEPVTRLAKQNDVSRKFLCDQAAKANDALDEVFSNQRDDREVLFYLPVTKAWLRQLVLVLVQICHSSFRGVIELFRDLLDVKISLGSVHNTVRGTVHKARTINHRQDLSTVQVGSHDEIFHTRKPVLVGADLESTYCYLLGRV